MPTITVKVDAETGAIVDPPDFFPFNGVVLDTTIPTSKTDFSMFPGNVAPTAGSYQALDTNTLWTIKGGESFWQTSNRVET